MGAAIGMCPKARIFAQYIEMEMSLREFDRARTLYQKYLEVGDATECCEKRFSPKADED
jgi:crooked neck